MFVMALLGAAIPFSLLSYATLTLETGTTAVINALTPVFTMLVTLAWARQPPTRWQVVGLLGGLAGIVILTWDQLSFQKGGGGRAVLAALLATICYAFATNFLKIRIPQATSQAVTFGSMAGASFVLAPFALSTWPEKSVSATSWIAVILLAVVSTALAYLIFYRLMTRVSALAATSVTFLVPVFAFLWGGLILDESITVQTVVGMVIAMTGTALTLGLWPKVTQGHSTHSKEG
jgi:drug/metabolite transporter (DMT)-like permease